MAGRPSVHKVILARRAPKPVGAYSQAILAQPGETLFVSGQIPIQMPRGTIFTGPVKQQAELCMQNVKSIVTQAGMTMDHVVKCTIYLIDMADYETVNTVYLKYFVSRNFPARAVVQVAALPKGVAVEIDAIAMKPVEMGVQQVIEEEYEDDYYY